MRHLVLVLQELYDDPGALAVILQGDDAHDVRGVLQTCQARSTNQGHISNLLDFKVLWQGLNCPHITF